MRFSDLQRILQKLRKMHFWCKKMHISRRDHLQDSCWQQEKLVKITFSDVFWIAESISGHASFRFATGTAEITHNAFLCKKCIFSGGNYLKNSAWIFCKKNFFWRILGRWIHFWPCEVSISNGFCRNYEKCIFCAKNAYFGTKAPTRRHEYFVKSTFSDVV